MSLSRRQMEEIKDSRSNQCLICNQILGSDFNSSWKVENLSRKLFSGVFESLFNLTLSNDDFEEICNQCCSKIQDYEFHSAKADSLKKDLIQTFRTSKVENYEEMENLEDFQLSEEFPEIEFDFDSANSGSSQKSENQQKGGNVQLGDLNFFHNDNEDKSFNFVSPVKCQKRLVKMMTCDFCGLKGLKNRRSLANHIKSHLKSKIYCEPCRLSFRSPLKYQVHLATEHEFIKTKVSCAIFGCQRNFKSNAELQAHFMSHKKNFGIPAFMCETCGKGFYTKTTFTQHRKIHSGIRNKECDFCGFRALSSTHLRRHIRARHTKEKNHICIFCGRAFSERYNMTSHIKSQHFEKNTEIRKYSQNILKCILCGSDFFDEEKLRLHMENSHYLMEILVE